MGPLQAEPQLPAQNPQPTTGGRYAKLLAEAPQLQSELQEAAEESLSLRGEAALARTLLGQAVKQLAQLHNQSGTINPSALVAVRTLLHDAAALVGQAADLEARKVDQVIDAGRLLVLLAALREDLQRSLTLAGMPAGAKLVDAAFGRAKWTGGLSPEIVREALMAPAAFNVKFREIARGEDGAPKVSSKPMSEAELAGYQAPVADPRIAERDRLKAELAEAEKDLQPDEREGRTPPAAPFDLDEDEDEEADE